MISGVRLAEEIKGYFEKKRRWQEQGRREEDRGKIVEEGERLQRALEEEGERIEGSVRSLHPQLRLSKRERSEEPPEVFWLRLSRLPYSPDEDAQLYAIWGDMALEVGFGFGWLGGGRSRGHLESRFRGFLKRYHRKATRYLEALVQSDYRLWGGVNQPPSTPSLGIEAWLEEGLVVARSLLCDTLIASQADLGGVIKQTWGEVIGWYGFLDRVFLQIPSIRPLHLGGDLDAGADFGEEEGAESDLAVDFVRWAQGWGLFYSLERVEAYFLGLQTSNLVILAGATGTGKSKLAQMVGRFLMEDAEREGENPHVEVIPVRPDWLDPLGLLGYYDTLAEVYRATPFLRLVLRAAADPMEPYFAILDEMNLAHVEFYLSDLLSLLETRRYGRGGELVDQSPLRLHAQTAPLPIEDPYRGVSFLPSSLPLPPNLWLIGTVNLDDTTKRLSPKVLDRAWVLEMTAPAPSVFLSAVFQESKPPKTRDWMKIRGQREILIRAGRFCSPFGPKEYQLPAEEIEAWGAVLDRIAQIAERGGFCFGMRAMVESLRFAEIAWRWYPLGGWERMAVLDQWLAAKIVPRLSGSGEAIGRLLRELLIFCLSPDTREEEQGSQHYRAPEIEAWIRRAFGEGTPGRPPGQASLPPPRCPLSAKKLSSLFLAWRIEGFADFQRPS